MSLQPEKRQYPRLVTVVSELRRRKITYEGMRLIGAEYRADIVPEEQYVNCLWESSQEKEGKTAAQRTVLIGPVEKELSLNAFIVWFLGQFKIEVPADLKADVEVEKVRA